MEFKFLTCRIEEHVAYLNFNRPDKANALHMPAWEEMRDAMSTLDQTPDVRVIVLGGEGKHFCAGIDLETLMSLQQYQAIDCEGRKREKLRQFILNIQDTVTAIERCRKPVIAAIHRACVGGAVDIITACDMRYCTEDAYFSIKEIDLGLVADVGTLQRLPTIINPGLMAEMAYTGRRVAGTEAAAIGLVTRAYPDRDTLFDEVQKIARMIADKSPLVVRGTKEMLLYKRDHSVKDALHYMASWNAGMILSNDLMEAFQATMEKRNPTFEN